MTSDSDDNFLAVKESAESGDAKAQYRLGLMYEKGEHVPQSYKYAYAWFNLSGTQSYEGAIQKRDENASKMDEESLLEAQDLSMKFNIVPSVLRGRKRREAFLKSEGL